MDEPQAPLPPLPDPPSMSMLASSSELRYTKRCLIAYGRACAQAALSTAPVQGVLTDERGAFARWADGFPQLGPAFMLGFDNGDRSMRAHVAWESWQARAALASAPHPPSNTLGDALTGPGSTSLRSSDPYRGVPPAERLRWLHSPASHNVNGYEWGIFRVKWVNGQAAEVWQTNADFSDLDAAMGDPVASLPTPPIASAPAAERDE